MFMRFGAEGRVQARRSAEPDLEVDALLPCLLTRRRDEARMDEVVEMLKVWWESPPVPTISHFSEVSKYRRILVEDYLRVRHDNCPLLCPSSSRPPPPPLYQSARRQPASPRRTPQ